MPSQFNYSNHYVTLSDEELLTVAAQEASLVEVARSAMKVELARRGLQDTSLRQYQEEADKRIDLARRNRAPVVQGDWVELTVPNRVLSFPAMCPSCLKANPTSPVSIRSEREENIVNLGIYRKYNYLTVSVPHCEDCARTFYVWQRIIQASILVGFVLALFIGIKFDLNSWEVFALVVPFCGPGIWASMSVKRSVRLVHFDEDCLAFRFKSMEYAKQFQALNSARY